MYLLEMKNISLSDRMARSPSHTMSFVKRSQVLNLQLLYSVDLNVLVELGVGDLNHRSWMDGAGVIGGSLGTLTLGLQSLHLRLIIALSFSNSFSDGNWYKLGLQFFRHESERFINFCSWWGCRIINRIDGLVDRNRS